MKFRYILHDTKESSLKYGICEICGKWCDAVFNQVEERQYSNGWTRQGCVQHFGHKDCLEGFQRNRQGMKTGLDDGPENSIIDHASLYVEFRGRCKELAEKAVSDDPSLILVRGWYHCPMWGKQAHWWAKRPDGTIVDPSVKQFPTKGKYAVYEEFDGSFECEYCHESVKEDEAYKAGSHVYCSYECYGHDVGF